MNSVDAIMIGFAAQPFTHPGKNRVSVSSCFTFHAGKTDFEVPS
jgi:hypothetical protein